jgi:predicted metalloprotease with PDZ domain
MKNRVIFFLLIVLTLSSSIIFSQQKFFINLNDRDDKLFKVTLIPEKLSEQNKIFQFASTAPGTYQTMNIGRFVRSFKAYDQKGKELDVEQISTNQWELDEPTQTAKIVYTIADTWHNEVTENVIYAMCGSNIENDNVLLNGQCVFGFFHGMQRTPIKIKLECPNDWLVGTALIKDQEGFYDAPDYDYVVDSPILLGKLTKAVTQVENTNIDVYTYSKTRKINSDQVLILLEDMLDATSQFTQGLPVNHYTFLFHFENFSAGAWEHNFSSEYIFNEEPLEDNAAKEIRSVAAHEFYHVITPLNIHSELISNFNFEKPTMSQHLWFYEGITEWASQILQLRDYLMSLDDFLRAMREKLLMNDNFDQKITLIDLSLHSTERQDQYPNIYMKGAIVGCLLDIRLLELSKGTKGLREVINQLYKDYGANKSFNENNFFNEFVNRTYPEIADFINRYIKGSEKLPVREYFNKLGIDYEETAGVDSGKISLGFGLSVADNKFIVMRVENQTENGLQPKDIILKVNGEDVNLQNAEIKFSFIRTMKVGDSIILTVERNGEEKEIKCTMQQRQIIHQFKVMEDATDQQLALRNAWMKNL